MSPTFVKADQKTLRELDLDERWLQERIVEDPTILGLGEVTIIERERIQPSGGRLDFLMSDPEEGIRFEIEVMLGTLDESHIIRTIEYWDIERTRFPQLEHRAVIVAEGITNRFFNIISLLNRAVPIIAIQMNALQFDDRFVISFTKVLDVADLFGEEEEVSASEQADRGYWEKNANPASLGVVDQMIGFIEAAVPAPRLTYNKGHIAVGTTGRQFAWFYPRRIPSHCYVNLLLSGDERSEWVKRLDGVGIYAGPRGAKQLKLRISQKELAENDRLIRELLAKCEEVSRRWSRPESCGNEKAHSSGGEQTTESPPIRAVGGMRHGQAYQEAASC